MLVPYFGFLLYLMFGLSFRKREERLTRYTDLKFLKSIKAIKEVKDKNLEKWESITYLEMSSKNYITKNYELDFFTKE